jgi:flagellar hook-associated protein 1 FlgK
MGGLFHILGVGSESLHVSRQGVDTAGHNIANAQVEGYSRQRVNVTQREPSQTGGHVLGNGAYIQTIRRAHDQWNESQLNRANQELGVSTAKHDALKALEGVYSPELAAGVSDELTNFFNALQELSNNPEDLTVRTNVREAAKNLTQAFRRVDSDLERHRLDLNEKINQEANLVTDRLGAISRLNVRIRELEAMPGASANDLRDQRDSLLRELTTKLDVHYYEDQHGMVFIRGPRNATLVDGGNAVKVHTNPNGKNGGMHDILITDWEGSMTRNVTDALGAGEMAGLMEVRDRVIPGLMSKNHEMAATLADNFNATHRNGFGLKNFSETSGRNFFGGISDVGKAASQISLDSAIAETTDAISAASSPLAPGDNVVINDLLRLKDARLLGDGDATLHDFYANYIGNLGTEVVRARHIHEANDIVVADLKSKREAVSGVSLDEEAMNLMKWQANFTASSKVITTVDEMLDTVLSLKR